MSVIVEDEGPVRIVTIERPAARNAVDPETATALYEAFLAFDTSEAAVAVLTGAGGAFCAGFDLKRAAGGVGPGWFEALAIRAPEDLDQPKPGPMGPTRLRLSKPVIAAVEGPAVAGGMELALWCDLRVMAEDAFMGVFCRRWGVPLIDGGAIRLPRIVGQGRALDLILTGREIGAAEAKGWGLADRLAAPGGALVAAKALAAEIAQFPSACMRADRGVALDQWSLAPGAAFAREWRSAGAFEAEGAAGAGRFAAGKGRGGDFSDI
ncbi:MAG: crotonase/enoyl-CoA hydratase family protein [Pikeienuella sp.]|uniref:crotonase/enoyl-CoA hydratase family protein n=1 Tax=Pikeienuella sp. TaxID=2831957 RepID=UPI00391DF969